MHYFHTLQKLDISIEEAWDFFSAPENLKDITPPSMDFRIISGGGEKIYPGMIIQYIIKPFPGITMKWITEITHVKEYAYFVDSQIEGPYAIWHHQHHFKEIEGGVEMKDILHYKIPYGIFGKMLQKYLIGSRINEIFKYRKEVLEKKFAKSRD